ncbi:BolA family transcriptional regulator [Simonsiella muelleri]|jgi:hypothetical protein|uniref:BolA family transcriptional regulator n=1 Tax=Simonsiella muelleri ATCC 29453 TaxID=641147 RepID=V9HD19_9NEIS|nr:BolA family protein [Simonsiella muelleri]AUX62168.1 BolA family transcriptional regulator [Simonsiella muelleri ATCC 29453]EFG31312.2 hypothetical protein HMPREF9021_00580 [Simonsiella muelleri ATCC 29453]UBQ54261.1 BolA family transcriptional regulator [Simonsiella muelleri]
MRDLMAQRLQPLDLQVYDFRDDSHLHAGHAGNKGGGHYAILLVSEQFVGVSRLQRQRVVQDLLADLFADKKIHALSIVAKTPDEYFA